MFAHQQVNFRLKQELLNSLNLPSHVTSQANIQKLSLGLLILNLISTDMPFSRKIGQPTQAYVAISHFAYPVRKKTINRTVICTNNIAKGLHKCFFSHQPSLNYKHMLLALGYNLEFDKPNSNYLRSRSSMLLSGFLILK